MHIEKFEEVIGPRIKPLYVVRYTCEKLLGTGENYGSIMLKVKVTLRNETGEEKTLDIVAKTTPPKGYIWEQFTTVTTFKKELDYYEKVAPAFREFLKERDLLDFIAALPKYYGGRTNLKTNSDQVDEDALLLLENLKVRGYELADRLTGFDLDAAKLIIDTMAKNHATAIAFREARSSEFKNEILPPVCTWYNFNVTKEYADNMAKSYIDFLKPFGYDFEAYHQKIANSYFYRVMMYQKIDEDNVFNTILHNDTWTNNILVKTTDGRVTDVKLVDFQVIDYQPGINDLIFFLYTSVQLWVLEKHSDDLIRYYYDRLIEALTKLDVDTSTFTLELFEKNVKPESRRQFSHIVKLLCPIFTKRGKAKELEEFSPEDFKPSLENVHENFAPRLAHIISEFVKRDWL